MHSCFSCAWYDKHEYANSKLKRLQMHLTKVGTYYVEVAIIQDHINQNLWITLDNKMWNIVSPGQLKTKLQDPHFYIKLIKWPNLHIV